jgi:hypothetical protein
MLVALAMLVVGLAPFVQGQTEAGVRVRVTTNAHKKVVGTLMTADADSVRLISSKNRRVVSVPTASIVRLEKSGGRRSNFGGGALIGGLVGGGVGLLLGVLAGGRWVGRRSPRALPFSVWRAPGSGQSSVGCLIRTNGSSCRRRERVRYIGGVIQSQGKPMLCQRCGEREAEIFQTQRVGDKLYDRDLCSVCAKVDYGVFLGALLQAQSDGAPPLTEAEEQEVRRVLDQAAPPEV